MTEHKRIAKGSASGSIPDMILDWEFQLIGILIVFDLLVMWFNSGFPALITHLLTKLPLPDEWKTRLPEEAEDYGTFTRKDWEVWVNLTYPKLGELLTCPVCFSRHLSYIIAIFMWLVTPACFINILGLLFWPGIAVTLYNKLCHE